MKADSFESSAPHHLQLWLPHQTPRPNLMGQRWFRLLDWSIHCSVPTMTSVQMWVITGVKHVIYFGQWDVSDVAGVKGERWKVKSWMSWITQPSIISVGKSSGQHLLPVLPGLRIRQSWPGCPFKGRSRPTPLTQLKEMASHHGSKLLNTKNRNQTRKTPVDLVNDIDARQFLYCGAPLCQGRNMPPLSIHEVFRICGFYLNT